jgi:hypothetical protein
VLPPEVLPPLLEAPASASSSTVKQNSMAVIPYC